MPAARHAGKKGRLVKNTITSITMGLNLALATAALALVAHTPPVGDTSPAAREGESFAHLADTLDVVSVAPSPAAEPAVPASGIEQPRTWSLLAMGIGVAALFVARTRR